MVFSLYWYYIYYKYANYFEDNLARKVFYGSLVVTLVFGIMFSRVYSGRHTFDQVILGFTLGGLNSYFGDVYFR